MNRKSFMAELRSLLSFMDEEDRAVVLRRYDNLFDEAGLEGEAALIESLGSPVRQILKIERQYRAELKAEQAAGKTEVSDIQPIVESAKAELQSDGKEPLESELHFDEFSELDDVNVEAINSSNIVLSEIEQSGLVVEKAEDIGEVDSIINEVLSEHQNASAVEAELTPFEKYYADEPVKHSYDEDDVSEEEPVITETNEAQPIIDESVKAELEPEAESENAYEAPIIEEEQSSETKTSGGRVVGAIFASIPLVAFLLLGVGLFLILGLSIFLLAVSLCAVGLYICGYIFGGAMNFMPDMLLLGGTTLLCFAFTVLLVWLGLFIVIGGCILMARLVASAYRAILGRDKPERKNKHIMKSIWKWIAIVAAILLVLGAVLMGVSYAIGGSFSRVNSTTDLFDLTKFVSRDQLEYYVRLIPGIQQ